MAPVVGASNVAKAAKLSLEDELALALSRRPLVSHCQLLEADAREAV
jgi:hypothetical protein